MPSREKLLDLIIKIFPHDNEEDYDITFEIVNKAFAPFHQVDYLLNGIFKDVELMNEINSNKLDNEEEKKNRKERIYSNGKIVHPIYKINNKSNNEDYSIYGDEDDSIDGYEDYSNDEDDSNEDDSNEDDSNEDDSTIQQNRKRRRYSSNRGGNKKNKKQHRKTKKHSKK